MINLQYKVSDEVRRAAGGCRHNFQCLDSEKNWSPCSINAEIGSFLEINECRCGNSLQCDYKIAYGFSNYCFCPVMQEIYRKYNA